MTRESAVAGCSVGTHGYNAIAGSCDPNDDDGHGTHVTGTIGAVGNNALGVVGVNWRTQIMGLKFLDASGSGTVSGAAGQFSVNPIVPSAKGAASVLDFGTNVAVPPGTCSLTLTGRGMDAASTAHGATVILIVSGAGGAGSFNITTNALWLVMRRNSKGTYPVRVTALGGFSSPVSLAANGVPQGVTAAFSPNPITPSPGGAISTLTIATGSFWGI